MPSDIESRARELAGDAWGALDARDRYGFLQAAKEKAMKVTADDLDCMARTLWGEARGETFVGRVAVAWVIVNRAMKGGWWGDTIKDVCLKPYQFSCWNEDDPNRPKMEALTLSDPLFLECLGIAAMVTATAMGRNKGMMADFSDRTVQSTHYHAQEIEPKWARGLQPAVALGRHKFYNNVP